MPNIEQQILDYCLQNPNATFAELSKNIEGFSGEFSLMEGTYSNIMLWDRISESAASALDSLQRQKKIEYKPFGTALQAYHIDGITLKLPLARNFKHYNTLHWLPILIVTI